MASTVKFYAYRGQGEVKGWKGLRGDALESAALDAAMMGDTERIGEVAPDGSVPTWDGEARWAKAWSEALHGERCGLWRSADGRILSASAAWIESHDVAADGEDLGVIECVWVAPWSLAAMEIMEG
jgi:hypothetical protein